MDHETRAGQPAEMRAGKKGLRVSGYAAVFGEEANIGGYFREILEPGAFAGALERSDVIFNVNHGGLPLARTGSGTLTLKIDDHGLHMSTDLAASDPDVQAITPKMERGDLSKMSFAFTVKREEWIDGDVPLRRILEIDQVYDVSIVNDPAYSGTEIGLRSLEAHRANAPRSDTAATIRRRMSMRADLSDFEGV